MNERKTRKFKLRADQIRTIAPGYGLCFATDRIMVEGQRVGFMYREAPDRDPDSGWRFLAGDESDAYLNNADNLALYDVNILANYDPDIIRLLDAPAGSAFERGEDGTFEEVDFEPPQEGRGPEDTKRRWS
jgi:hypothetical protein